MRFIFSRFNIGIFEEKYDWNKINWSFKLRSKTNQWTPSTVWKNFIFMYGEIIFIIIAWQTKLHAITHAFSGLWKLKFIYIPIDCFLYILKRWFIKINCYSLIYTCKFHLVVIINQVERKQNQGFCYLLENFSEFSNIFQKNFEYISHTFLSEEWFMDWNKEICIYFTERGVMLWAAMKT